MGFMYVHGQCYGCKETFSFNADLVPSLTINGVREPFCQSCMDRANDARKKQGKQPLTVLPGAYEPQEVPF